MPEKLCKQGKILTLAEQSKKAERFHRKTTTLPQCMCVCVCAFQPSLTCSYSTHTYILGNKKRQEKKQIIFLYINAVVDLPCI